MLGGRQMDEWSQFETTALIPFKIHRGRVAPDGPTIDRVEAVQQTHLHPFPSHPQSFPYSTHHGRASTALSWSASLRIAKECAGKPKSRTRRNISTCPTPSSTVGPVTAYCYIPDDPRLLRDILTPQQVIDIDAYRKWRQVAAMVCHVWDQGATYLYYTGRRRGRKSRVRGGEWKACRGYRKFR